MGYNLEGTKKQVYIGWYYSSLQNQNVAFAYSHDVIKYIAWPDRPISLHMSQVAAVTLEPTVYIISYT